MFFTPLFVFYRLNRQLFSMSSLYFSICYLILFVTGEKKFLLNTIDPFLFLLFRFLSLLHSARQTAGTLVEFAFSLGQFSSLFVLTYISEMLPRKTIAQMPDSLLFGREASMIHFTFYRLVV